MSELKTNSSNERHQPLPKKYNWRISQARRKLTEVQQLANRDSLTNLDSRRLFDERVKQLTEKGEPFGILMLDLDKFKKVNDDHGHHAGDVVLVKAANDVVLSIVGADILEWTRHDQPDRETDTIARWGGEEIAALLPKVSTKKDLFNIAERIRNSIGATPYIAVLGGSEISIPVTASIGGIIWRKGDNLEDTLIMVDHNLYEAKRTGRNKTII
jgi:diguanylate cyclase (GGDEF)-like protein